MIYLNQVTFSGDVASEVKTEEYNGRKKYSVMLCSKSEYKGKVTEHFANVVAWGDSRLSSVSQGDNVLVVGSLAGKKYPGKDGGERCFTEINARTVEVFGSSPEIPF